MGFFLSSFGSCMLYSVLFGYSYYFLKEDWNIMVVIYFYRIIVSFKILIFIQANCVAGFGLGGSSVALFGKKIYDFNTCKFKVFMITF